MLRRCFLTLVAGAFLVLGTTAAQAVTIDLSSPQEGAEVCPGEAVELSVVVTNDTAECDCVVVVLKFVADGIKHPVLTRGYIRVKLQPGESVTKTVALTVPADLELEGPVAATIQAEATGKKSQTEAADSLSITLVPLLE